jgi:hypothetical protein
MNLVANVVSTFLSAIAVLPRLRLTTQNNIDETTLTVCRTMYHMFGPEAESDAGLPDEVDSSMCSALPLYSPYELSGWFPKYL